MPRILKFTTGPDDWKALLADPDKHWRMGYSARTLAHCWEAHDGFPPEVSSAFAAVTDPEFSQLVPLLAVPEFKVALPGGNRASQNDIFVLARSGLGPVSIMVEGKVNESFGPLLSEWQVEASPGKQARLEFLLRMLRMPEQPAGSVRYQLLHRAASALITGEQYRAAAAVLLVHSFSEERTGWPDYEAFVRLYDVKAKVGAVQLLSRETCVPFFAAWVPGTVRFCKADMQGRECRSTDRA